MRIICTKYKTTGDITKLDGTPIPEDEPLFLFRAQDKLLVKTLGYYRKLCISSGTSEETLGMLDEQIAQIEQWQRSHFTRFPL